MPLLARILLQSLTNLNISAMKNGQKPIANPYVMLREEFDDWAVVFDPDSGHGFGLSPTGVYLWKLLDGRHSIDHLVKALRRDALDVPENVQQDVRAFVDALVAEGLATFESTGHSHCDIAGREKLSSSPPKHGSEVQSFTYEPPKLVDFRGGEASGSCCTSGSHQQTGCGGGALTSGDCGTGTCAQTSCDTGNGTQGGGCNCYGNDAGMCSGGASASSSACVAYCCSYGYMTFTPDICPGLTCCSGGPNNVVGSGNCKNGGGG
jgi:SynChlorMet cassette protein ScmD